MGKWPLWIGTTLLTVAALQLVMIFILPSLPLGIASEAANASNDRGAANDLPNATLPSALPLATDHKPAALPLYTACVHETSKHPVRVAANDNRIDILFIFSGSSRSGSVEAGQARTVSEHIEMHAPAQFSVVMFRSLAPHAPAAEGNDGATQSSDCRPF